jgi:sec-independent protein translocase protein TatC
MIFNLIELRNRLIYLLTTFISISCISFFYRESLLYFAVKSCLFQIKNELPFFIYTNLTEVFATYFKLSLLAGAYVTLPFFLLHLWSFVVPGLYKSEYLYLKKILLTFIQLWVFNNFLTYYLILPWVWNFFLTFEADGTKSPLSLHFEIKLNEYVQFLINTITCCSLSSQFFFILILWALSINQYSLFSLEKNRRFVYIFVFVFAALITPPDLTSQLILALPLLSTYEFLILSSLIKNEYRFNVKYLK